MKGNYRFLATRDGRTSFAYVEIEASKHTAQPADIAEELCAIPNTDDGEVNRKSAPSWIDAAIRGIENALAFVQSCGVSLNGWHIRLMKVSGTPVDTREDAVECAAALATVNLMAKTATLPAPQIAFDGGHWVVQYPVPVN
jgi:hypothetical protein